MAIQVMGDHIPLSVAQKARDAEMLKNAEAMESIESIKTQGLVNAEALATMYEDNLDRSIKVDEVLATIYETILEGVES